MGASKSINAGWRRVGLALIALGLALRVLLAPGIMPVASAEGVTLTLCTAQGPVTYKLYIHGKQPLGAAHDPCPYGAMAATPLVPLPLLLAEPRVFAFVAMPLFVPREASPHIGRPAPPPPATGPPALA